MALPAIKADNNKKLLVRRACSVMAGAPSITNDRLDRFDCWPSNAQQQHRGATAAKLALPGSGMISAESARPALVEKIEQRITAGISAVRFHFPNFPWEAAAPTELPLGVPPTWWLQDEEVYRPGLEDPSAHHLDLDSDALNSPECLFALARINVFRDTAKEFCRQFRHFQDILCTVFAEYDHYIRFLVKYMKQERHDLAATNVQLGERIASLEREVDRGLQRNQEQASQMKLMEERALEHAEKLKAAAEASDELRLKAGLYDSTVAACDSEKGVLARRIMSLEAEVEGLERRLELPEKKIAVLEEQLVVKEDFLVYTRRQLEKAQSEVQTFKRHAQAKGRSEVMAKPQVERELGFSLEREAQLQQLLSQLLPPVVSTDGGAPLPDVLKQFEGVEDEQRMVLIGNLVGQLEIQATQEKKRSDDLLRLREGYQISDRIAVGDFFPEKRGSCRWFLALGNDETVPYTLRGEGRIRNNKFSLKALKINIHTFMNESAVAAHDAVAPRFHHWMSQQYPEDVLAMTYSFQHALQLFPLDVDVYLFTQLLDGKISELVWLQPYQLGELMKTEMEKLSVAEGHGGAKIPQDDAVRIVAKALRHWEAGHVAHVISYIPTQGALEFRQLFSNRKHVECDFLQALRTIFLIERVRLIDDVRQCVMEDSRIIFHKVTPSMLVQALFTVDPQRPESLVLDAVEKLFGRDVVDCETVNNDIPIINRFDASESFLAPEVFFAAFMQHPWVRFSRRKPLPF